MRVVAFVRNVNQGQRGHPSTDQLLAAFAAAGLDAAVAYRSNGTVVFEQPDVRDPAEDIALALAELTGLDREVFTLAVDQLAAIVAPHRQSSDLSRRELTVHRGVLDIGDAAAVATATRGRCNFLASGPGWVVTANERDGESNATPVIERVTGGPATSRGLSTVVGVVERFAPEPPRTPAIGN